MNDQERKEQILYGFAVEPVHDADILAEYIATYPELKSKFIELALELNAAQFDAKELSVEIPDPKFEQAFGELMALDQSRHLKPDPFSRFQRKDFSRLCEGLGLSRGFMIGIRDRRVLVESIPERFITAASKIMEVAVQELRSYLNEAPQVLSTAEFKADKKPITVNQVTFEQLINDTEMSDEQRERAMEYLSDDGPA